MYVRDREGAHSRDFLIWNQQLYLTSPSWGGGLLAVVYLRYA